ncbi:MAG TPA: lytic transglycosylase domain-containing protein, partial [Thermoanaerobaculia bacterium]|nr:lytic transglycosylase domain-containing protein [Thermoanaerobaculia bacterium]
MSARVVEALADRDLNAAFTRGMALLGGGTGDDAADRVVRALDKPEVVKRLSGEQLALFGETFQQHRHYDRAVAYLRLAIQGAGAPAPQKVAEAAAVPKKKKKATPKKAPAKKAAAPAPAPAPPPNPRKRLDELQFALGRSHFGAEEYAEAQQVYLAGAAATPDLPQKATFFWHAARAAQLRGDDKTGEQLMTSAIAVKGKHPATVAALTQRLRLRLKQRRAAEAGSDLALLRRMSPNERAVLEGSLAYAVGMLAAGNANAALAALDSVPPALRNDYDDAEFAYWRGRALESRDAAAAVASYLAVLRSSAPSHFDSFARKRLASMNITRELQLREAQVAKHVAAEEWELAKRIQTDRVLLKSDDAQLKKLAAIYAEIPAYKAILDLKPAPLPRFPSADGRDELLIAMGLADEAAGAIEKRWGLRPAREGLTRSLALNQGSASRESIYAIEIVMKSVPSDFHPELLPDVVRRLLYPRYFYSFIAADAKRYEADPSLVLSIMREESRFNPRAKSAAAARGLLQFIITTARDIGQSVGLVDVDPEDLYDPRVIIRLGAKYISELAEQFAGNRYRTAAAYNAGPKQVALWARMQPGEGDDYFLTAVNFDETKHYVRKVLNSYEQYDAVY